MHDILEKDKALNANINRGLQDYIRFQIYRTGIMGGR